MISKLPSFSRKNPLETLERAGRLAISLLGNTVGPVIMLVGHTIVVGLTYSYFYAPLVPKGVSPFFYYPWTVLGLYLLFNIFFNWHMTSFTDPGSPPFPRGSLENQEFPICKKCNRLKPPRTHHCSVLNRCVLAMDHYCPWMNNCIGFYNYKYFFLFLLHTTTALIYVMITCMLFYPVISNLFPSLAMLVYDEAYVKSVRVPSGVSFSFFLSGALVGGLMTLFGWHIYLAMSGSTTIEFQKERQERAMKSAYSAGGNFNDYDLGPAKNFEMLFGKWKYPLGWTIPSLQRPKGDGMHWPTVKTAYFGSDSFV